MSAADIAQFRRQGINRDTLDRAWTPAQRVVGEERPAAEQPPAGDVRIRLHHLFDLATHFFTKTRWNRTLKLIHGYHDYPQS